MEWERVVQGRLIDLQQKRMVLEDLLVRAESEGAKKRIKESLRDTARLIEDNQNFLMNFNIGEMQ